MKETATDLILLKHQLEANTNRGNTRSWIHDAGKLVEIWKKQADGKWKCIVDTYNSDLPVAPAPETNK